MINQEKVRDMTRMAAYEDGYGEKQLRLIRGRRQEYVALQLMKSFVLGMISYVLLVVLYFLANMSQWASINSTGAFYELGKQLILFFVLFMAAYLVLTFFVARKKYAECRRDTASYLRRLRRVGRSYGSELEKTVQEEIRIGNKTEK